ncbi:hypothetical protein GCM10011390_18170 [Aureimonas endophytica]|uniref:Uncharacterized protein n=1 Tax=Aureimonas endophytica TaxID=2027858 RepID=A0A916ZIE6_9HYPH|nr:hypothetical protein [Aureimonas endophytica]GGD99749.1 hypothetical protein GCM10011390_18170 [Aureimonas endophytica]
MRKTPIAALLLAAMLGSAGCVSAGPGDPSSRYVINVVTPAEVAIGNDEMTRSVNRNTLPGTVERTVAANPGLGEALARNRVDLSRVAAIRVRPSGVADVFLK